MANLLYFVKEGARGFYHAKLMTSISIVTIAATLFVAGILALGMFNIHRLYDAAVEKADFVMYITDTLSADSARLDELTAVVRRMPHVKTATIIDKAAAWKRFSALYGRDILTAVDNNPLPVSIEILLKNEYKTSSSAEELKTALSSLSGVETIRYAHDWIAFLTRFKNWFFWVAAGLSIVMATALYLTITNTIKLTIYARKELVRTMRFVGATRFFIAMPFIVEGIIQGVSGGCIAACGLLILKAWLGSFALIVGPAWLPFSAILLGIIFGWIGSSAAVRKFLT